MEVNLFKYAFAPAPAAGGFAGSAVLSSGVLSSSQSGIALVITAFSSVFSPDIVKTLLSFSILTFCLTTQIGIFIFYENAILSLKCGKENETKITDSSINYVRIPLLTIGKSQ
jgi:Na+/alanine symporter